MTIKPRKRKNKVDWKSDFNALLNMRPSSFRMFWVIGGVFFGVFLSTMTVIWFFSMVFPGFSCFSSFFVFIELFTILDFSKF